MNGEKIKILDNRSKWAALRQKNDYDYSNIPVTRRDLRDMERRLLQRLTYRISALIIVIALFVFSTLLILVK